MKSKELVKKLQERLSDTHFEWQFDEKHNKVRLDHKELGKGMDISLPGILSKYETKKELAIDEVIYTIQETFSAMEKERVEGFKNLDNIFPIIRSTSFPKKSKDGHAFVTTDHTAETRIYYALDLGNTYRLIDVDMLDKLNVSAEQITEAARFQIRKLNTKVKKDVVAENVFYFLNENDGYDASRILNDAFLKEMRGKIEGDMTVSVPHQDVLIIGDIRNEAGYDVLAQMTMHFFTVGTVPITSLSFIYEDGDLEPIFILAKNRVKKEQEKK
ncbi:DUF1444 domain-containing protein [Viridibacillus arvi]|uniref:DUF1444 domain-containing protein n=1 Tax=Viridibacillus arvi TaxID=263475 RepID=UPI003D01E59F